MAGFSRAPSTPSTLKGPTLMVPTLVEPTLKTPTLKAIKRHSFNQGPAAAYLAEKKAFLT